MIHCSPAHHFAHEFERLRRNPETESGSEPGYPKHPYGVFDKCLADVPQDAGLQIGGSLVWIDDVALVVARDRIDGEVPARQILLEGNFGRGVDLEPLVSARSLSLGARKCVLLVGLGMQENREIFSHGAIAELFHLFGRCPDHDKILVCKRPAEPSRTHSASATARPSRRSRTAPPTA